MEFSIPNDVKFILDTLEKSGFEAYIVGGCVRDFLLNLQPVDWDITTNAKPEEIKIFFKDYKLIDVGESHGTIGVIINNVSYEVTTFRVDGEYIDCRHPSSVQYTQDIHKDLSRRDFTINAIAYNDKLGFIDPFNGIDDIRKKALRTVGNPDERFQEDALRILRALRFASVYGFDIELNTANSLIANRKLLNNISNQRINVEFNKLICGSNIYYILKRYKDVIATIFPEFVSTFDCTQNIPYHNKTLWKHTIAAVSNIEPDLLLRLVMLFHDIGKPMAKRTDINGVDHFKGHCKFSAQLTKTAMERLAYPTALLEDVVTLVEYHDERNILSKTEIKKLLKEIGPLNFERLLKIQKADLLAKSKYKREENLTNLEFAEKLYGEIIKNNECYTLKQLNINGADLLHLGISQGQEIGEILRALLDLVIEDKLQNNKEVLIQKAKILYCKKNNKP